MEKTPIIAPAIKASQAKTENMGARKRALTIIAAEKGKQEADSNGDGTDSDATPLSPAARLFHQPRFNCNIITVMGVSKAIDVDVVKAGLEASIVRHPRFSSLLISDEPGMKHPRWVPTKVSIDDHIIIPNLNTSPSSKTTNEQLIEDYVSSLSTLSLPLSRPLWDLHVINLSTSESEAVAVFRVHHSLGDGMSLMSLLLACTRKTSDPDSAPTLPATQKKKNIGSVIRSPISRFILSIWTVFILMWHTLVDVLLFICTSIFLSDSETPIKGVEGVEFHKKRIVHRTISLDDVKIIKQAVGATVNDVLIGVTSFSISRYLDRRYSSVSKNKGTNDHLPKIRLRTTVLVNVRPAPGIHALKDMMEGGKGTRWGNWVGYVIMKFPIAMYKDPLEYVRKGMKTGERKKKSLEAIFTYASGSLIVKLFGIKVAAALCHRMLRHTTISFSNIVGPIEEVAFYGHPLVYIAPTVCGHPQAVTLHFQSYMNKIKIVLAVDELSVPDPHQLLDDLEQSLKDIKDSLAKN